MSHKLRFLIGCFFSAILLHAQQVEVITVVDSTQVKIGEQINLSIQIKSDSFSKIIFPESPVFTPFELLEQSQLETLSSQNYYLFTKKYSLIQFDSGAYWIPPQKIVIDESLRFTDSISIEVATVQVDTLKQPLFDIKPIQQVKRNYTKWIQYILVFALVVLILGILYYLNVRHRKKKAIEAEKTPPFEWAINALKALEENQPNDQEEYKIYYSKLTEVIRRYLEEEAKISALESTSDELIDKLELRKDAGTLDLSNETLSNLKSVLRQADLVKFARSAPEFGVAINDRKKVEQVVIQTKEALPEPTEEELAATAAYQKELAKKQRKKKIKVVVISCFSIVLISLVGTVSYYGFTPVKDTVLRYPTKILRDKEWVVSQYGNPLVAVHTPKVLIRESDSKNGTIVYNSGNPLEDFFVELSFKPFEVSENKKLSEEEQQAVARELMNNALAYYDENGGTNVLAQNDSFTSSDGTDAFKLYGTLDFLDKETDNVRCRFVSIVFPFDQGTVELRLIYPKEDRYGMEIEERLLTSVEIIKEL